MLKITFRRLAILMGIVTLFSCNGTIKESTKTKDQGNADLTPEVAKPKTETSEDYSTFYNRFHADSLFQMSRIKFPIEGYFTDTLGNEVKWSKSNWIMHRTKIQDADTLVYTIKLSGSPTLKKEELYIEGGGFRVERQFQKMNGKWYLIEYIDENL